ncbi:hypothetical protein MC885_006932, partial [Smutsia gigantea]
LLQAGPDPRLLDTQSPPRGPSPPAAAAARLPLLPGSELWDAVWGIRGTAKEDFRNSPPRQAPFISRNNRGTGPSCLPGKGCQCRRAVRLPDARAPTLPR